MVDVEFEDDGRPVPTYEDPVEETPSEMLDIEPTKLQIEPKPVKTNVSFDDDFSFDSAEDDEEEAHADFDF